LEACVTKDFGGGLSLAVAYVGTNANKNVAFGGSTYNAYMSPQNKNLGQDTAIVSLTKTF
jgi:hypothetical protein